MFRQFSYRLIALIFGLIAGAPHRRGGSTRSEATDREYGTEADSGSAPHPGEDTDFDSEYDPPDRGDVPGWVLITLMTAGLVVALWALAGEAFTSMFQDAMNKVRGAG
ncbi:hypothetical protein [Brevibacterium oceani]|uniref:hypothetical protein n=1 Tax=Brevibacterium oceani TaxID=358099 RepID=UPI001B332C82|nr:hypothetical protein [Brevibacterium oceani]